ncbi:sulfotransferase [Vicingus serpentipes]|uniref:Sulfotransferase n=1 Tax=Vicingus serpentipes TaxID=1926625 RepID=A0A5C6RQH8_9FLAO|nr:sulfotransferase [Vicingus serpentipes]TXB64204.1 sulfotransferase [Vicingus serpentipes]
MEQKKNNLDITPCFIVGIGRSGTTLLTDMLNGNPSISAAPENNFILFGKDLSSLSGNKLITEFKTLFKLNHNHTQSIWKPDLSFLEKYDLNEPHISYQDLCKEVYLNNNLAKDKNLIKVFVDKNPVYSLYVKNLITLFPDAKFIILTRDYRDNIVSRRTHTEGTISKLMVSYAASWNLYYKSILKYEQKFPNKFTRVKYENIVNKPKETLNKITDFLNIAFDEQMLHNHENSVMKKFEKADLPQAAKDKIIEMHNRLKMPLNNERINYWENKFSALDLILIETICSKTAKEFDYLSFSKATLVEEIWAYLRIITIYPLFRLSVAIYYCSYYNLPYKLKKNIFKSKYGV